MVHPEQSSTATLAAVVLFLSVSLLLAAEPPASTSYHPARAKSLEPTGPELTVALMSGIQGSVVFRLANATLSYSTWFHLDFGYFDSGPGAAFRKSWVGGGAKIVDTDLFQLELNAGFSRANGDEVPDQQTYLEASLFLGARLSHRYKAELSYGQSIPLSPSAVRDQSLDRLRLEYLWNDYEFGVGYAGSQTGTGVWKHIPFVSVSRSLARFGSVEVWLQRAETSDRGHSLRGQVRWEKTFGT